jgi:hypothetical protein
MGSFWWKDILRLNTLYRGIAMCEIGDGSTICFWDDLWAGEILSHTYPRLPSFVRSDGESVKQTIQSDDLDSIFVLPLSQDAFGELDQLQEKLQELEYDEDSIDRWFPIWGQQYSSRKFTHMYIETLKHIPFID